MGCCASSLCSELLRPACDILEDDNDEGIDTKVLYQLSKPIIMIIGGPSVHKTSLGKRLASELGFTAIISSELVRMEVSDDTEYGRRFKQTMLEGHNLSDQEIFKIIQRKMISSIESSGFILVGYPRSKVQAQLFNKQIRRPDLVIYIWVRKQFIQERMAGRAVANERFDDTENAIQARIKTFFHNIDSVVKVNKNFVTVIDGQKDTNEIFQACRDVIDNMLIERQQQS